MKRVSSIKQEMFFQLNGSAMVGRPVNVFEARGVRVSIK